MNILFVCHGNICRSPMAEFVMKDAVEKAGRSVEFYIESAAVSSEEIGNPVYPPARRLLAEHGIDCTGKTARRIRPEDYEKFDLIIGMDNSNMVRLRRFFPEDPAGKIVRLLDLTDAPGEVDDPWYSGDFDQTYREVLAGVQALLAKY
ncbi:MAG: low molecular weight phosphotyrosine protein phosphatase [Lentisphaeria bacterium]|nr:low molecular weight phosphotyrosine protein phosphatase [Lentisphaeria bacterium]